MGYKENNNEAGGPGRITGGMTIRQKIMLGFSVFLLLSFAIGYKSYSDLSLVQRKLKLIEAADDHYRLVLDVARLETTYRNSSDYSRSAVDLEKLLEVSARSYEVLQTRIKPLMKDLKGETLFNELEQANRNYVERINLLADEPVENITGDTGETDLVETSYRFVSYERERVDGIIRSIRKYYTFGGLLLLGAGIILIPLISHLIVSPLVYIQKATRDYVDGDFTPMRVSGARDETEAVITAFNSMIEELDRQQDMVVQSEKLKSIGVLASGIAHELNNPLNNISTSCQIILSEFEQIDREFHRKLLSNIEREVERAQAIVWGLLDFSREKEFSIEEVGAAEVIDSTLELIKNEIPGNIAIETGVPGDLKLLVDRQKMQQVILNLVINAVQSMPGGGRIEINAHQKIRKDSVELTVADNGPGIDEDVIDRIFDPFFTTRESGGTGLGLSIVHGIVKKHGGSIRVESQGRQGAAFILELPGTGGVHQ